MTALRKRRICLAVTAAYCNVRNKLTKIVVYLYWAVGYEDARCCLWQQVKSTRTVGRPTSRDHHGGSSVANSKHYIRPHVHTDAQTLGQSEGYSAMERDSHCSISVPLSVCHMSHSCTVSKRLSVSSKFFYPNRSCLLKTWYISISQKRLETEARFQRTTNMKWPLTINNYQIVDSLLWCSSVGYPSDS